MMLHWWFLSAAIIAEVVATSLLKSTDGFTRLGPSVVVIIGYLIAFYFLSLTLRTLPVGIAYAVWAGVGMALIALIGWAVLGQALDAAAVLGIGLIVAGVVVLNVFSASVPRPGA
jgi:small multidrug resistance pump